MISDKDEAIAGILEDDSPYPEVRSAVANTDDETIPVGTMRSWVLGVIWSIIIPVCFLLDIIHCNSFLLAWEQGLNQFFYFRYPSVTILGIVAQLLTFPMGRAWAQFMPNVKILGISVNPGPFSIKEHVLVTIMASVGNNKLFCVAYCRSNEFICRCNQRLRDGYHRRSTGLLFADS